MGQYVTTKVQFKYHLQMGKKLNIVKDNGRGKLKILGYIMPSDCGLGGYEYGMGNGEYVLRIDTIEQIDKIIDLLNRKELSVLVENG